MKILNKTIIHHTKFLDMYDYEYLDNENNKKNWICANRPNDTKAVVIVAFVKEAQHVPVKLVVISEYRVPLEGYIFELPAGLIDKNESVEEAGSRELLEESGYKVTSVIKESPFVYNSPGLTNESVSYLFVNAVKKSAPKLEPSEDIAVVELDAKQVGMMLYDAAKNPDIKIGAKAWMVFSMFARFDDLFVNIE